MKKAEDSPPVQDPTGLTTQQAAEARRQFGKNTLASADKNHLLKSILGIVREPMFILLAVACALYFFLGDLTEAVMMLLSIAFVAGIGIFQETKSEKALDALRAYTEPQVRAMRDGIWVEIPAEELVPGDLVSIGEGERVAADGTVLQQNDLSVAEAVLTGESLPVEKKVLSFGFRVSSGPETQNPKLETQNLLFHGTTVASGQGIFRVTATGNRTKLGQLGLSIEAIEPSPTPLQVQIGVFVKRMGMLGAAAFAIVLALNYGLEGDFWKALLFSLTVAMALIPEEIPVAFSSFMALGAFRMIKSGILAKQPKTVESLGSATIICLDKTGTITENHMSLAETIDFSDGGRQTTDGGRPTTDGADIVLQNAFWASEPTPIDAMELALQNQILTGGATDFRENFELIHEYPLGGTPPMMTHIWENRATGQRVIACKGAVERVLRACKAGPELEKAVLELTEEKAALGYRILGVAVADFAEGAAFPESQDGFDWQFAGLTAFYDPPKANAGNVLQKFYTAGIRVMMITGDHAATAKNIAKSVGLRGWELSMTGDEAMKLDENALREAVGRVNVFARMFPEAKLRVVEALKSNGETVAMSGDGVNDGPALKAAQIGVAMGKKGSDIAKTAASLVLLRDDLDDMAAAIGMGRRIYDNLRKAIRYVISIHLPILLAVLVPLVLGWEYPHMLLPLHVIFLELVMDPIAAIAFENEPAEPNLMQKPPRPANSSLFSGRELAFSIVQGAAIGAAVLFVQWFATGRGLPENAVRACVFATLVFGNLFLVLANRSMDFPIYRTIFYQNKTLPIILGVSLAMLAAVLFVPFMAVLFRVAPLSFLEIGWCALAAFVGVAWFEVWKVFKNALGSA